MSFFDARFPERIGRGAQGGAGFLTTVLETVNGWEARLENWSAARCRYNVASGLKRRDDIAELIAFFRIVRGKLRGFRFKDWADFEATEATLGVGNGARRQWQLAKVYSYGGETSTRYLTRPVSGTVRVFLDGAEQASGWSVDLSTGVVTFASPPGNGVVVAASCEFDVPCRFDVDGLESLTLEALHLGRWSEIPIVELREATPGVPG
jgi:uncharacterized protein (TIGR02217 family)